VVAVFPAGPDHARCLLAQLCIRHDLTMLSTDAEFRLMSQHRSLKLSSP
jgi:hypothetical protein